ncbi:MULTISPECIES: hypothetical protein [unclassified Novosphingobium]|uniref:hypothetical protein n=1 Tax=unclassified Novosphingobium TaxID=2644732 RepID=UPI000EE9FDF4|nr:MULTISPECIES: hypothetical protein [unclassified Novosphingobium]HCF24847.1 hypothetical protein [Novosphingobium sp.]HQV04354.1 hypothetical protein [Novosphingobium sp.]
MKLQFATMLFAVALLVACKPNSASPNMTALDACKRADVKDKILTEVANAFVSKAGGLVAMFGGPEVFAAVSEDFKSRATIENPKVADSPMADQKIYEVHCTVDLATVNSAKDNTPVEFRNVEFTIHYNNGTTDLGTEDYYLIPNKASFFRTVFVNGMPQAEYLQQQQAAQPQTQVEQPSPGGAEANSPPNEAGSTGSDTARQAADAVQEASDEAARAADEAAKEMDGGP